MSYASERRVFRILRESGVPPESILAIGKVLESQLRAHGYRVFREDAQKDETALAYELRIRGHRIALARAWFNVAGFDLSSSEYVRALRREYQEIVDDPPPVLAEISLKAYKRDYYNRMRAAALGRKYNGWHDQLREELMRAIAGEASTPIETAIDSVTPAYTVLELTERWPELVAQLTPAEALGLDSLLSGEPTTGPADRQRRSRAMRKLRRFVTTRAIFDTP